MKWIPIIYVLYVPDVTAVSRAWTITEVVCHDGVLEWKHFPRYWPFVRGIQQWPMNSPHKGQWRGALMFSLITAWTKGWINNRDADNLRRHHIHYHVTAMPLRWSTLCLPMASEFWRIWTLCCFKRSHAICDDTIRMTSHERHDVSNRLLLECLLNSFNSKENNKAPHHWPFIAGYRSEQELQILFNLPCLVAVSGFILKSCLMQSRPDTHWHLQGSFWVWVQPMRDDITM